MANAPDVKRRLIGVRGVAEIVGKCVSSVWADVAAGNLPQPIRIGGATRWDEAEIHRRIDEMLAARDGVAETADNEAA